MKNITLPTELRVDSLSSEFQVGPLGKIGPRLRFSARIELGTGSIHSLSLVGKGPGIIGPWINHYHIANANCKSMAEIFIKVIQNCSEKRNRF